MKGGSRPHGAGGKRKKGVADRPPSAAATTRAPRPTRFNLNPVSPSGFAFILLSVQTLNPKP